MLAVVEHGKACITALPCLLAVAIACPGKGSSSPLRHAIFPYGFVDGGRSCNLRFH